MAPLDMKAEIKMIYVIIKRFQVQCSDSGDPFEDYEQECSIVGYVRSLKKVRELCREQKEEDWDWQEAERLL